MTDGSAPSPRAARLRAAVHLLTAVALAVEGVADLGRPEKHWPFVALCWVAATAIGAVTLGHTRLEARFPTADVVVYLAEAAVCGALVAVTAAEGKVYLPYAWLVATAIQATMCVLTVVKLRRRSG